MKPKKIRIIYNKQELGDRGYSLEDMPLNNSRIINNQMELQTSMEENSAREKLKVKLYWMEAITKINWMMYLRKEALTVLLAESRMSTTTATNLATVAVEKALVRMIK
jgi:hypothetical protein